MRLKTQYNDNTFVGIQFNSNRACDELRLQIQSRKCLRKANLNEKTYTVKIAYQFYEFSIYICYTPIRYSHNRNSSYRFFLLFSFIEILQTKMKT